MAKGFVGREKELKWLRSRFDACAKRDPTTKKLISGGPQLAVIVAESGLGKSRLVQALYQELTTDPAWDPPEVNYWPDTFDVPSGTANSHILVNPDMHGHKPAGSPRFLWLGTRWTDPGPDQRNVESSACKVVEFRRLLDLHVQLLMERQGVWDKICTKGGKELKNLKKNWPTLLTSFVADKLVPYGGLMVKVAQAGLKKVQEGDTRLGSAERAEQREAESATELFVEEMQEVLSDRYQPLPVVLWLDDAQWMDAPTREAVEQLYRVSLARKLPLLIVVTHWEQEWEQLASATGLRGIAEQAGEKVSVWRLEKGGNADLRGMVRDALPGLTPSQQELLVSKSDGNFLTMVENISDLQKNQQYFEQADITKALNELGDEEIAGLAGKRQEHVKQRFDKLDAVTKQLLGWSSHLGVKFLRGVVVDFAKTQGVIMDAEAELNRCERPLVILTTPDGCSQTREWRDRAFLEVARKRFGVAKAKWTADLDAVLREHLVRWINNSFDADGDIVRPPESETDGEGAEQREATPDPVPVDAAILLGAEERRDLLGMARNTLPLPANPDWENPEHAAALKCRILSTWTDEMDHLWDRVREVATELECVDWHSSERVGLSLAMLHWCREDWEAAGAWRSARNLCEWRVARRRRESAADPHDAKCRWLLSGALMYSGDLDVTAGDLDRALAKYEESLEIRRALCGELGTPESRRDVTCCLLDVGNVQKERGELELALESSEECLALRRELLKDGDTPAALDDVRLALDKVAAVEEAMGNLDAALTRYTESLAIRRTLCSEDTTVQARWDVASGLDNVARTAKAQGNPDGALAAFEESLGIARSLAVELGTAGARHEVASSLIEIGDIERECGNEGAAILKYEESLEILRALCAGNPTSGAHLRVSFSLDSVADIEKQRGNLEAALAHYEESLQHKRAAEQEDNSIMVRLAVSFSLEDVAEVQQLLGRRVEALANYETALRSNIEILGEERSQENINLVARGTTLVVAVQRSQERHREGLQRIGEVHELALELGAAEEDHSDHLDTAAAVWEETSACLEALGRSEEAREFGKRAKLLRARIAGEGN